MGVSWAAHPQRPAALSPLFIFNIDTWSHIKTKHKKNNPNVWVPCPGVSENFLFRGMAGPPVFSGITLQLALRVCVSVFISLCVYKYVLSLHTT